MEHNDQEVNVQEFIKDYLMLTTSHQEAFKYLQQLCNKYYIVDQPHDYFASKLNISRHTVMRAFILFEMKNWIKVKVRPYKTNVYEMKECFAKIDLNDEKTFIKKQERENGSTY